TAGEPLPAVIPDGHTLHLLGIEALHLGVPFREGAMLLGPDELRPRGGGDPGGVPHLVEVHVILEYVLRLGGDDVIKADVVSLVVGLAEIIHDGGVEHDDMTAK